MSKKIVVTTKTTVTATTKDPRAAYKRMAKEAHDARVARVAKMVANGCTPDAAWDIIDREAKQHFAIASARAKCGRTDRPATIGEILAAKMAKEVR